MPETSVLVSKRPLFNLRFMISAIELRLVQIPTEPVGVNYVPLNRCELVLNHWPSYDTNLFPVPSVVVMPEHEMRDNLGYASLGVENVGSPLVLGLHYRVTVAGVVSAQIIDGEEYAVLAADQPNWAVTQLFSESNSPCKMLRIRSHVPGQAINGSDSVLFDLCCPIDQVGQALDNDAQLQILPGTRRRMYGSGV